MNVLLRELKAGRKPFLFWSLGLFVLVFAGVMKYTGVSGGGVSFNALIQSFPRVVQAVLGVVGLNMDTLGGYYAVLAYFAVVCTALYAIYLGTSAVGREATDKTYEFLFTKPRSRSWLLLAKLTAGLGYLLAYAVLNVVFSLLALALLSLPECLTQAVVLFSAAQFFTGLVFFSLAAFFTAACMRPEQGSLAANLCFLGAFVAGIGYDMLPQGGLLRLLSPLKYFSPADLLAGQLSPGWVALCLVLCGTLLVGTFYRFETKDLRAA